MAGSVSFTPSAADFVDARRDIYRQFLHSRRGRVGYLSLPAIFLALGAAEALVLEPDWLVWNLCFFGALGAIFSGVLIAVTWSLLPRRSRRLFERSKTLQQAFRYDWSDEAFGFESSTGNGNFPWTMLFGWYRGRKTILVYSSPAACHFIPMGSLGDAELADLEATLAASPLRRM